jgi:putative lipase involved disintegration of autophagic bodies
MPVGWEPDDDGFRGYVFATEDNSTVVLTIKGTSVPVIDGGPTVEKDKLNDNLLFSCCCARVSRTWTPVCDCYRGGRKCDEQCVEEALIEESLFYPTGVVRVSPSVSCLRAVMAADKTFWEHRICITTSHLFILMRTSGSLDIPSGARLPHFWGSRLVLRS